MVTTLYIVFLSSLLAIMIMTVIAVKLYHDALKINPELKKLEQIKNEIGIANATLISLKQQVEGKNKELVSAEEIISKAETVKEFLEKFESEYNEKKGMIQILQDEIDALGKNANESAKTLQDLNDQVNEQRGILQDLNVQITDAARHKSELEVGLSSLEAKKTALETEISEKQKELKNKIEDLKKTEDEYEKLKAEVQKLQNKLSELSDKKKQLEDLSKEIGDTTHMLNKLQQEVKTQEGILAGLKQSMVDIEENFEKKKEDMWRDLEQSPEFSINLNSSRNKPIEKEMDFISDFSNQLKRCDIAFTDRTIKAFHTGLKAQDISPIVVLSGISGTGKSLLPKLYAQACGMNFLTVPVQPRWDSPQDMLGFFNYMQDKYKATELSRLLWSMDIYNNDKCKWKDHEDDLPMNIILLDEMNLARVEYYFSDLLSKLEFRRMVSDTRKREERGFAELEVECGVVGKEKVTRRLFVNNNILFVGTMNEDETTQMLSDKVMDRSNMIRFGKPAKLESKPRIDEFGEYYSNKGFISFKDWKNLKYQGKTPNTVLLDADRRNRLMNTVNNILSYMDNAGRPFAHRVWQSIETYVSMYPEANINETAFNNAIADQIEMKVLPKLNGIDLDNDKVQKSLAQISTVISETNDEKLCEAFENARKLDNSAFFQWKGVVR